MSTEFGKIIRSITTLALCTTLLTACRADSIHQLFNNAGDKLNKAMASLGNTVANMLPAAPANPSGTEVIETYLWEKRYGDGGRTYLESLEDTAAIICQAEVPVFIDLTGQEQPSDIPPQQGDGQPDFIRTTDLDGFVARYYQGKELKSKTSDTSAYGFEKCVQVGE